MRAFSGLKERRWRIALERRELIRLASMLEVIRPDLILYQQLLTDRWKTAQLDESLSPELDIEEPLRLFICFESLLPALDELVSNGLQEEKSDLIRINITEEESTKLRVIGYCARRLPELPSSIAWLELAEALTPVLAALDRGAFEYLATLVIPKSVSCTVDDLKRGRNIPDEAAPAEKSESGDRD
jgi:hypothetical protein